MKKYLVLIISFVMIFMAFQIVSGLILTASYTPDFSSIGGNLSRKVEFGTISIPLLFTLLTASLAYFLSQKKFRISRVRFYNK
jgi:quinol-cytochrome oxidoreductase complex cytochrome b subunit